MARERWTDPEIECLLSLTGDMPWRFVVTTYQTWAQQNGFPFRSDGAMKRIVQARGVPRAACGNWITSAAIVHTLGISHTTVARWRQTGLEAKQLGQAKKALWYIRRDWLRAFARNQPHLFVGHSEGDLLQVLDCQRLARKLAAQDCPRRWQGYPVICVETGRRFPTINAAAKAAFVSKQRMRNVVRKGGTANGLHWKLAPQIQRLNGGCGKRSG